MNDNTDIWNKLNDIGDILNKMRDVKIKKAKSKGVNRNPTGEELSKLAKEGIIKINEIKTILDAVS